MYVWDNQSTWDGEGESVQGYPQLHSRLEGSLDYVRPCVKKEEKEIRENVEWHSDRHPLPTQDARLPSDHSEAALGSPVSCSGFAVPLPTQEAFLSS